MRKLWAFGDSNTEDYNPTSKWAKDYIKWKGYKPKVYTELISDNYECKLYNFGLGGTNNYHIFQKFCENVNLFNKNDIIIIQWTEPTRFRLAGNNNDWVDFYFRNVDNKHKLDRLDNISIQTIQEILLNRLSEKYKEEIEAWESLIKLVLKDNKYIIWSPFNQSGGYGKWVKSMETISDETDRLIDDPHLSESGQIKLANILIDKLENTKKSIV